MSIYISKATADKGQYIYCNSCSRLISAHFSESKVSLYALSPLMTRSIVVALPEFCECLIPESKVEVSNEP